MTDAVRDALAEILELCAIGDVDECTEALGWGKAIQRARAALSEARAVPDGLKVRKVDPGFRWDGDAQQHVPQVMVEFEPVPANSPNDAPGWLARDTFVAALAATPSPAEQPKPAVRAEKLYDAIKEVLLHHRLSYTEGEDAEAFPLVDMLCPPGSRDISKGRDEITLICDAIYNDEAVRAALSSAVTGLRPHRSSDENETCRRKSG